MADPIVETAKDGTRQQIGTKQITTWLQLNADGTARLSMTNTIQVAGKTWSPNAECREGVWQLNNGRLYFVIAPVPRPPRSSGFTWVGAPRVTVTDAGMTITDIAGAGLAGTQFSRTHATIPGSFPPLANLAALKTMLARIAAPTPRWDYGGVASEQALKAVVHRAVAARDIPALMAVTYPLMAGLEPDPRFSTYMQYMNWLAFGVPQVKDMSPADFATDLARLRRESESFPPSVSPRGIFLIGKTLAHGASSFSSVYYGVVAGKWAILGSPYNPKLVATQRRRIYR